MYSYNNGNIIYALRYMYNMWKLLSYIYTPNMISYFDIIQDSL